MCINFSVHWDYQAQKYQCTEKIMHISFYLLLLFLFFCLLFLLPFLLRLFFFCLFLWPFLFWCLALKCLELSFLSDAADLLLRFFSTFLLLLFLPDSFISTIKVHLFIKCFPWEQFLYNARIKGVICVDFLKMSLIFCAKNLLGHVWQFVR